jgi:hypothetical protein
MQHRGLGDTIAMITKSTGVSRLARAVAKATGNEDCGCEKRQESLNKKFPYKRRK